MRKKPSILTSFCTINVRKTVKKEGVLRNEFAHILKIMH